MSACVDLLQTLAPCLVQGGMDAALAEFLALLLGVLLVMLLPVLLVILVIWVDRKVSARIQDRLGPNRVGPYGLLQNVADALKLITKEDITPVGADVVLFNIAPVLGLLSVLLIWVVVPFTPLHIGADLQIGVLYFLAVSSLGTLSVMIAGWSGGNKYGLLGAFRVVALMISYEVPLALALLLPVMIAGSLSLQAITEAQTGMWMIVLAPVSALIFYISNIAETGRAPFDLIEAESEIVAGYNIEYSGMKFGLFMAMEFLHFFTVKVIFAVIFLGGWSGPFVDQIPLLGVLYLGLKTLAAYLLGMLIRYSLTRFRADQVMHLNWKFLVPFSVANLLVGASALKLCALLGIAPPPALAHDVLANLPQAGVLLLSNALFVLGTLHLLRERGRAERLHSAAGRMV